MKIADILHEDEETSPEDMIITRYELGQVTYDQARRQLQTISPADQFWFWDHELHMARELQKTSDDVAADHIAQITPRTIQ